MNRRIFLKTGASTAALLLAHPAWCAQPEKTTPTDDDILAQTRARIERLWPGAAVFDHHGMTEVGPVTYQCPAQSGSLHVLESAYLPEVINPQTEMPVAPGETGELVLTTLDRIGSPLLRYRTGDLVRPRRRSVCICGRHELAPVSQMRIFFPFPFQILRKRFSGICGRLQN